MFSSFWEILPIILIPLFYLLLITAKNRKTVERRKKLEGRVFGNDEKNDIKKEISELRRKEKTNKMIAWMILLLVLALFIIFSNPDSFAAFLTGGGIMIAIGIWAIFLSIDQELCKFHDFRKNGTKNNFRKFH